MKLESITFVVLIQCAIEICLRKEHDFFFVILKLLEQSDYILFKSYNKHLQMNFIFSKNQSFCQF